MKKPYIVLGVVIVATAGLLAYFLLNADSSKKTPEVKLPSEETKNDSKEKNTVTIKYFTFDPATITVKEGETVTWVNEDGVVHTIKSIDFSSPNIKNADSYKFQFTKAGTYEYSCGTHPYMKGKVVVE